MAPELWFYCCLFGLMLSTQFVGTSATRPHPKHGSKPNVLLIMADDLLPILGSYEGRGYPDMATPKMLTPNIDSFAKKSVVFNRAYTQYPMCNPSRTSMLTGRRPDTTKIYELFGLWRARSGDFSTLPQYFKDNGYYTSGSGKIFHDVAGIEAETDPISWSEKFYRPPSSMTYWKEHRFDNVWKAVDANFTENVSPLMDRETAEYAKASIKRLGEQYNTDGSPFFIATGFKLPHLPFVVPEQFLQSYPLNTVPQANNPAAPTNLPFVAWPDKREFLLYNGLPANYTMQPDSQLPADLSLDLRRAYFAAVSYVDSLVGELLTTLRETQLDKDTIVVFTSDHGFSLGEHSLWGKYANFELANQVPLMIHVPCKLKRGKRMRGSRDALVELIDLFPTLVDLAGLPEVPVCPADSQTITLCHEGTSLLPLLKSHRSKVKTAAFSQVMYAGFTGQSSMGYSMRTKRFRYTEWYAFNTTTSLPLTDIPLGVELYNHLTDPQENHNIAHRPELEAVVSSLSEQLVQGWRAARRNQSGANKKNGPNSK